MIFRRDTTPATMRRGTVIVSTSTPSMRKRTRIEPSSGSKWMSEVPCSTAWAMIWLTSLMTGASSADSRRSTISPRRRRRSLEVDLGRGGDVAPGATGGRSASRCPRARRPRRGPRSRSSARCRRPRGRWPGRPSRRAGRARRRTPPAPPRSAWPPAERSGWPPTCRRGTPTRSRWSRPWRSATARAWFSSDSAPCSSSTCLRRRAGGARRLDGLLDARAVDEAELDDDVGQEASAAAAGAARRRDAVPVRWTFVGRSGRCGAGTDGGATAAPVTTSSTGAPGIGGTAVR